MSKYKSDYALFITIVVIVLVIIGFIVAINNVMASWPIVDGLAKNIR